MIKNIYCFFTNICNSKCKTCLIWKNTHKNELECTEFKNLLTSKVLKNVCFCLLGGEFTLYSKYIEVISLLNQQHKKYVMFTNGLLPHRIYNIFESSFLTNISISLDAIGEKHDKIRGIPGNFSKVHTIINWLHKYAPITKITCGYTISKYNTTEDLTEVIQFCKNHGITLRLNIAIDSPFYNLNKESMAIKIYYEEIIEKEKNFLKDYLYLKLYSKWITGKPMNCEGIKYNPILLDTGKVYLCHNYNTYIGNIYSDNFDTIWASASNSIKTWYTCNRCWMQCHRSENAKILKKV